jgi:hypothetical protein
MMTWQEVKSNAVTEIGFDPETSTLGVVYQGGKRYHYYDVPYEEYLRLMNSDSYGRYINHVIVPTYTNYEEV